MKKTCWVTKRKTHRTEVWYCNKHAEEMKTRVPETLVLEWDVTA